MTYQVRVDLDGAKPPIWRRLLLSSDLMLDELHAVLQQAMGWTDSHLHQFLAGENKMDRFAVHYHTQFMLDEGAEGVLENRVRLDELLYRPEGPAVLLVRLRRRLGTHAHRGERCCPASVTNRPRSA